MIFSTIGEKNTIALSCINTRYKKGILYILVVHYACHYVRQGIPYHFKPFSLFMQLWSYTVIAEEFDSGAIGYECRDSGARIFVKKGFGSPKPSTQGLRSNIMPLPCQSSCCAMRQVTFKGGILRGICSSIIRRSGIQRSSIGGCGIRRGNSIQ